jgi:hypothetical protein
MPSANELQRLAAAANQLRPEWPVRSLLTLLTRNHSARSYRDLAVALAWVACDPSTKTPERLAQPGPWWLATSMSEGTGPSQQGMRCVDHPAHHVAHCPECVQSAVPRPATCVAPTPSRHLPEHHKQKAATTT